MAAVYPAGPDPMMQTFTRWAKAPSTTRVTLIAGMDLALLENVPLFSGLTPLQLRKVAELGETQQFEPGVFLFREGSTGEVMYIVMQGKVRISKTVPGIGEEALAILEPGQYFGEMALIDDSP